jgi:hypothetical protein
VSTKSPSDIESESGQNIKIMFEWNENTDGNGLDGDNAHLLKDFRNAS